jgi:NAD(P)H-flavin reductase
LDIASDRGRVAVVDNRTEAAGVRRLVITRPDGWSHRPGQVAELACEPGGAGFFAIASGPDEATLDFLVKVGPDTMALTGARRGDTLTLRGPFGAGFTLPDAAPGRRLLFVGAGTALAALRSGLVAARQDHDAADLALLVGVRRPAELAFADELARLDAEGARVHVVVSRADAAEPWSGARGWVQDHIKDVVAPETWVFVAGSDALEDAVEAALDAAGVPLVRVQRNYRPDRRG